MFVVKVSVSPKGCLSCQLHLSQERFSVTVFGEGSGPWTSPSGEVHTPTASKPIAVMWPSTKEIRSMLHATWTLPTSLSKFWFIYLSDLLRMHHLNHLQSSSLMHLITEENHAHFQLPSASTASHAGVADGGASESTIFTKETLEELRELHRDGVGATSVGLRHLVHWITFLSWHPKGWWELYRTHDFVWENCANWRVLRYFACYLKMVWRKHIRPCTAVPKARWMRLGNSDPSLLPVISELTSNIFIGTVSVLVGVIHSFAGFPLVLCQVVHLLHVNVSKRIGSKRMLKNISEIWTSNSLFLGVPCLWMLLVSRSEKCRNNVIPHFFTLTSPLVTFQKSKDMPKTSALLFEGSWRIHVMIDAPLDEAKIWKKLSWDQKHAWMRIGWMGQPWGYCSCFSFLDTWLFVIVLYLFEYLCK